MLRFDPLGSGFFYEYQKMLHRGEYEKAITKIKDELEKYPYENFGYLRRELLILLCDAYELSDKLEEAWGINDLLYSRYEPMFGWLFFRFTFQDFVRKNEDFTQDKIILFEKIYMHILQYYLFYTVDRVLKNIARYKLYGPAMMPMDIGSYHEWRAIYCLRNQCARIVCPDLPYKYIGEGKFDVKVFCEANHKAYDEFLAFMEEQYPLYCVKKI